MFAEIIKATAEHNGISASIFRDEVNEGCYLTKGDAQVWCGAAPWELLANFEDMAALAEKRYLQSVKSLP